MQSSDQDRLPWDVAVGIVMALHRTDQHSAASEIISAATDHDVTVFALSAALLDIASRADPPTDTAAHRAALIEWGFELR